MNEQQVLMEKHVEARQAILTLEDKTPPAIILNLFGRWFPKSISDQSLFYWILQIVLIHAVIILPGLLLSLALGEMGKWPKLIYIWFAGTELPIFGFILSHTLFRLAFHELANHTVYKITKLEDLSALVAFCRFSASSMYALSLTGSVLYSAWSFFLSRNSPVLD